MDTKEMTNRVYDTLMQNYVHPQLDLNAIDDPEVDADAGLISFEYMGQKFIVKVQAIGEAEAQ